MLQHFHVQSTAAARPARRSACWLGDAASRVCQAVQPKMTDGRVVAAFGKPG